VRKSVGLSALAVCLATSLTACKASSGATPDLSISPSTSASATAAASGSAPASSVAAASSNAPASSSVAAGSSVVSSPAASTLSSSPPAVASSSPSAAAATPISVSLAKVSQPIAGGDGGTATIQRPTTHGLPAAVDAALLAPATQALTQFESELKSSPCTNECTPGDYLATFAVSRSDSAIVSGIWTILTYFPGAAHPETVLDGVIVRATDGVSIAPAELFTGTDLGPLVAPSRAAIGTHLTAIGCNGAGASGYDAATSAIYANYEGVAVAASGLLVGLSDDQVAAHACGNFEISVGWSALRAGLSSLGVAVAAKTALPPSQTTAGRCSIGVLGVAFGSQKQLTVGQFQVEIVFTNAAGVPCWLLGFPGVDLSGEEGGGGRGTISLARTSAAPLRVTIAPGASAHAELTYLVGPDNCDAGGTAWTPDTATVTPPDETVSVLLFWSFRSVDDCQTGATHPGTYVGPVLAGA
jgi:hypothetical protein